MNNASIHTFHIPVLGLCYTVDTPVKVARYGISSVVSIIEDELIEKMREYHCGQADEEYLAITNRDEDYRARRVTAYLNLLDRIVKRQMKELRMQPFAPGSDIVKYFELLPETHPLKKLYDDMLALYDSPEKENLQTFLRQAVRPGAIDVNIMSKIDNLTYASDGTPLPAEFSDALAAFRGFANSGLNSSVVLSAGYNPRLYAYIENFNDFFPDSEGNLQKKIILKVSDFRSAQIQGKILAKKGIWVSEFRIESGLNCGGHAFPTDGYLLGPILDEFKVKRDELAKELYDLCNSANLAKGNNVFQAQPHLRVTVQGGIGTAAENNFLLTHYNVDATGWGSPFLLVPEATNVDDNTLGQLATAEKQDYYLSNASPLGIPFHNFRKSTAEQQRMERIKKGRPGSPCYKKFLSSDTEFTAMPICTSSRQYQDLKIRQIKERKLPEDRTNAEINAIVERDCLCEGLGSSVLLKNGIPVAHSLVAVTICPGPNLAYFSGVFSLRDMVDHIYGRKNILNDRYRSNMFINELQLYADYFAKTVAKNVGSMSQKQFRYLQGFKSNMLEGIAYYYKLVPFLESESPEYRNKFVEELNAFHDQIDQISIPVPEIA